MSQATISKSVLHWALERSGVTPTGLERKFPKIRKWLSGEEQPTLRQLEALAKTTYTPLGFFFLKQPPDEVLPIPHFRTQKDVSRPSPNLLEIVQIMRQRQAWMRDLLIDEGQERLPFVGSARLNESPISIAQRIRRILDFQRRWASTQPTWTSALRFLREAMENAGILVVVNGIVGNNTRRKLNPNEFRGFVLVDEYAPLVFVNGADGKAAQMFTLAHELAHVILGKSAAFDLRQMLPADDPIEQACNQVAAEFLVPERELREIWDTIRDKPDRYESIARHFKVSVLVAARRALDLNLISRQEFLDFYQDYLQDERRKAVRRADGGDFYATQDLRIGRRFAFLIIRAASEGKILYSDAYQLTGLYGRTFDQYVRHLKIGRIK